MGTPTSEIFNKSGCLEHEDSAIQEIEQVLLNCGYTCSSGVIWRRGTKTVVLKLVDDWSFWADIEQGGNFPYSLSRDTLVITDNLVNSITQFKVLRLPDSFFGIYSYTPEQREFTPDRRYSLVANRFDDNRVFVLSELITRELQGNLNEAYVTFNCIKASKGLRELIKPSEIHKELILSHSHLPYQITPGYLPALELLTRILPYKNFDINFDEIFTRSWLNMVIETYVDDNVLSLSEKTFRSLVTPAPGIIYGSRHTSIWLQNLGFDVVDEIIDYRFDSCHAHLRDPESLRYKHFIVSSIGTYRRIAHMNFDDVASRFKEAAESNIAVLENYKKQWPDDFAEWLVALQKELSKD